MCGRQQALPMTVTARQQTAWWSLSLMFLLLLITVLSVRADTFLLEAEQYVQDRIAYPRTAASGIWAVHFYQNEVFPIEFCLQSTTTITVINVRYSNDGGQDYVDVALDGERLDTFVSLSKTTGADEWNVFENTGQLGRTMDVLAGKHVLELSFISTDRHGVEIDFVAVDIGDSGQDERMLQCTAYCDDSVNYKPTLVTDSLPSGWLQQKSQRTTCALEQNVKIELYHPGLRSYQLTAHLPKYSTLLDSRLRDYQGCKATQAGQAVWFFNDFDLDTSADQMVHDGGAVLSFEGSNFARNTRLTVRFPLSPNSDTDTGTRLTLRFRRAHPDVGQVHILLAINDDLIVDGGRVTDPSTPNTELSWFLDPDDLTREDLKLTLTLTHRPFATLHVQYLRLEVQPAREVVHELYRDTMTMVQAVLSPAGSLTEGMMLYRPDNRIAWYGMQAVTVLKKVSWSEEFEEVFRLDLQGVVSLKPRSDYASRSPPYGTTVIVGPSDPTQSLACAPIARIDIDPWALKFTMTYKDSSVSDLTVRTGSFGVRAIVNHQQWASTARAWPVAVITSMWVADGKAHVDHVSANGASPRGVLGTWNRLFGISFAFFRQCISRHNSQAPDITMELLEPHPDLKIDMDSF